MRLKSYHGATLTEAMRAVRDALGEDAIIVATREDDGGGIRVTAALDDVRPSAPARPVAAADDGSEALEIIAEALTRHHVASSLAEKIMASATQFASDDPQLALGAAIDTHFKFQTITDDKPLMLVGPPGAGKTLCTAKFATRSTMANRPPTVISTDLERAGGLEQLAAFTRLLKLNLVEIEDHHALRDLVTMPKKGPVYIDTSGGNPFDAAEKLSIGKFISAIGDATLVLPAGLDAAEAIELAREFQGIGASKLLITRLDQVRRLGSVLRLAYETRLPLSCYSASSKVTEAPQPMNPVVLARLILKVPGEQAAAKADAKKAAQS